MQLLADVRAGTGHRLERKANDGDIRDATARSGVSRRVAWSSLSKRQLNDRSISGAGRHNPVLRKTKGLLDDLNISW